MPRNVRLYLEDILTACSKILKYAGDSTCSELIADEMRLDAIVRNFEIIGEAASKVPPEIRNKYSSVEWRKIADFRNLLAHEYFGIDYEIMWNIIRDKLPSLRHSIQSILEQEK